VPTSVRGMELVLVRHAQPEWTRDRTAQVDPGLTEVGRRQAEHVADRLEREPFDAILISTATRARQTAAPLLPRVKALDASERAWLHEIQMPAAWEGTPSEEVGRVLVEARDRPREDWWDGLPGGESFRDFHARVTQGLVEELGGLGVYRDAGGLWHVPADAPRLLLVAHAGTNSVVLGHLLGLEPEPWEWERFASDHASLTTLRSTPIAGGNIFSLQRFSDVGHLPPGLVTA
jgi:broad specificity phosphatase PhoE